ncbi:MAG: radical SAM/SPASM domain-containing protein [Elusimicrobia bacterium]|nr:radical SAM/SPASM domain-containing protein [Elusimicrobiota bacterium]
MPKRSIEPVYQRQDRSKQTRTFSSKFDVNAYLGRCLGPRFRAYRRMLEGVVQFRRELPFPVHMDFETAFACNLRCVMCTHAADVPASRRPKRPPLLDFELYRKVIDEGVRHTLRSVGLDQEGEPLLNPRLGEFISYARSRGIIDVMFNDNATLLTRGKAEMLLDSGLTRLHFSLDAATEATYRKIRVGGDFGVAVRNILALLELKRRRRLALPVTRVSFVRMRSNERELDEFVRFWRDKVDYIAVQEYNTPSPGDKAFQRHIGRTRDANFDFRCTQPWFRMVMLSDGSLLPCCMLGYSRLLTAGNAATDSVRSVWTSPRLRILRRLHKEGRYWRNPVCASCAGNFVPASRLRRSRPDPLQLTFPLAGKEVRL